MKKLFTLAVLLFFSFAQSQTLTEKYNRYNNHYEYFNSDGTMLGYKSYNSYNKSWEYYEVKPQYQVYKPQSSVNVELTQQVLAAKQARYNYNQSRIQQAINDTRNIIDTSEFNDAMKQQIKDIMNRDYIPKLQSLQVDLSIDDNADSIIKWLYDGLVKTADNLTK